MTEPAKDRDRTSAAKRLLQRAGKDVNTAWHKTDKPRLHFRRRVYDVIEVGRGEDGLSKIVDAGLIILIVLSVLAFTLETVPSVVAAYGPQLYAFELFSVAIFTIEYILRIWSAVEVPFLSKMSDTKARFTFAMRPYLLIDLLAIAPFYLSFILPFDLRILRVLRLFRFLKLARYSPAMHTLVRVIVNERRSLLGAILLMMAALIFAATGVYYLERGAQPDKFGTIPDAAWWAMATLTTVGYGDVSPVTPFGKIFGSMVMVVGLGMFALPIAILSTGFAQEAGRRDFVVTWSLMSRIPLLAELDASQIAEIMRYLAAHNFPPHWEVIQAGSPGEAMYFIASGRVKVNTSGGTTELGQGDFFGEIAMLEQSNYDYSFTTTSNCRLLKLNREDFRRMSSAHPTIGDHIKKIADARKAARAEGRAEPTSENI